MTTETENPSEELEAQAAKTEEALTLAMAADDINGIIENLFTARGILTAYDEEDHEIGEVAYRLGEITFRAAEKVSETLCEDETIDIPPLAALYIWGAQNGVTPTRADIIEFFNSIAIQATDYLQELKNG